MSSSVLGGRYRLGRMLGQGGMSQVFQATDLRLGREVALKLLRAEYRADPEFVAGFMREAQTAASLSHPSIAGIYDVGQDGDQVFIVMELVDGQALREYIDSDAPFEPSDVVTVLDQVCDALDYAHSRGVIHRDLKPENILITADGRVKIADFGIAGNASADVTTAGLVVGSAYYMSPEQAQGYPATAASDVYSAGVVAYEMLTGRRPFTGDTSVEVASQHLRARPSPPSRLNRALPKGVDAPVLGALAKEPARRPATAMALADAVAAAVPSDQAPKPAVSAPLPDPLAATVAMPAVRAYAPSPTAAYPAVAPAGPQTARTIGPPRQRRLSRPAASLLALAAGLGIVVLAFMAGSKVLSSLPKLPAITPPTASGGGGGSGGSGAGAGFVNLATSTATVTGTPTQTPTVTITDTPTTTGTVTQTATITLTPTVTDTPTPSTPQATATSAPTKPPTPAPPTATAVPAATVPPSQVAVPNVVGLTEADGQQKLKDAGLATSYPNYQTFTSVEPGHILSQLPAAGTIVPRGSTVYIAVRR